MNIPTEGEEYAKLIEHLRLAQEASAMLAHLVRDESRTKATGWLTVSEGLKGRMSRDGWLPPGVTDADVDCAVQDSEPLFYCWRAKEGVHCAVDGWLQCPKCEKESLDAR